MAKDIITYKKSKMSNDEGLLEKDIYVNGVQTRYSIRSDGSVFSNNYRGTGERHKISLYTNKHGHRMCHTIVNGKTYMWLVHILVAEAFIKKSDKKLKEVKHKNGDRSDNSVANLEWCTRKENINHAIKNNLLSYRSGEDHYRAQIRNKDVEHVCELLENDISIIDIANETGISYATICMILYKRNWTNISNKYDFSKRSNHKHKKINPSDVHEICRLYRDTNLSISEIARRVNINMTSVYNIIHGISWKNISSRYNLIK